jgi:hypothetical protein
MQLDPVTKQWNLVPGSVKPDMQTVTIPVPPNVTPEKTIPGAHFWSSDTVTPAVTNSLGYTISKRVPVGAPPTDSAASALTKAQSGLPDFGTSQPQSGYKVGQRAVQNGKTYEFDGRSWNEVKQ